MIKAFPNNLLLLITYSLDCVSGGGGGGGGVYSLVEAIYI